MFSIVLMHGYLHVSVRYKEQFSRNRKTWESKFSENSIIKIDKKKCNNGLTVT